MYSGKIAVPQGDGGLVFKITKCRIYIEKQNNATDVLRYQ
jgi:hypothetical protein